MTNELAGGVAVITGAGRGIGEGIARAAAERGMKLVLADINEKSVESVAADIRADGGQAVAVTTDVSNVGALESLADRAFETHGEVNLVVNNAGIMTLGYTWEIPAEQWQKTIAINILGAIQSARAFIPRMIASGKKGRIANVSSLGAMCMIPIQSSYIMSKHALLSFSECLALELELAEAPISVSCVLPGLVVSGLVDDAVAGGESPYIERHRSAMNRVGGQGLPAREAGMRIMDGIAQEKFWVTTDTDLADELTKARSEYLLTSREPNLSGRIRDYL